MTRAVLRFVLIAWSLAVVLVLGLGTVTAQPTRPPMAPHQFYGTVTINGVPAPDGTVVSAEINGVVVMTATTKNGLYGYDTASLLRIEGEDGDVVSFQINGAAAEESVPFEVGGRTELNLSAENRPPTVVIEITSTGAKIRLNTPVPLKATFSKPVFGFIIDDVKDAVGNGIVGNFAGSGADYTFEVTPNAIGKVTVDIAAGVAEDASGNPNAAAAQLSLTPYDDDLDGAISKNEAITAVRDYFGGNLTKDQTIAVIRLYFYSGS